jgi:Gas vesicle protein G
MGLISGLLLLPLAPVRATAWVADLLVEEAERELYGPGAVRARLAALNRDYEEGVIGEEEFEAEEERLLDLLDHSQGTDKVRFESRRDM